MLSLVTESSEPEEKFHYINEDIILKKLFVFPVLFSLNEIMVKTGLLKVNTMDLPAMAINCGSFWALKLKQFWQVMFLRMEHTMIWLFSQGLREYNYV
jgi:hypothetical protein